MAEQNLKSYDKPSLYIHVTAEGDVFMLPYNALLGAWVDLIELKGQLTSLEKEDGQLFVSSDLIDEKSHADTELIFELVDSYSFEVHAVDPHPAVHGYKRSYLAYITSAINVAEIDVEGTEELLEEAKIVLEQYSENDTDFPEVKSDCESLEKQLEFAKYAHQRLLQLELDICTEIKTAIQ